MKKFFKITVAIVVAVVLLLVSVPFFFKDKIELIIKQEGNKLLNAEFDFKGLDISLISNFPLASLTIEDFYLKGIGDFENDTLVAAEEVTASVNIASVFGDSGFDIREILLDNVSVKAVVLEDGKVNWDVMKASAEDTVAVAESDTVAASPFRIKLQKLAIEDFSLIYDDRLAGMYAAVQNMDATCSGDFGSKKTLLKLLLETEAVTFKMDGVPFVNNAVVSADMDIDADLENNKFIFNENSFSLNAIKAAFDGWLALTDEGVDMDIKLNSNKIGFKEILSLIPAIYTKDFAGLKTDGEAVLVAYAKGSLVGEDTFPEFKLALDVKNAMFKYPSLPAGVNGINISADVYNPGGSLDACVVNINPLNFVMAGNPFSLTAAMKKPMTDLSFDVAAKGKLDLGKVKDIYPLEDMSLNGLIDADMRVNGCLSYIEKEQYDKIKAAGSMKLNDMALQMKDFPNIDIKNSLFTFTPRYLQLSETEIKIGDNDITFDSRFENYLGFVLKGTTLAGTLNVKSNRLNLNDFMTADTAAAETENVVSDTVATGVIVVPENIDFRMQAAFKEVIFDNMTFKNLDGLLIIKDGKVDMKNLSLATMGGNVVVNGYYKAARGVQPELNAAFKLEKIEFLQAYKDLNIVQKLAPIFNGLTGDFSGNMSIDTKLDNSMTPIISTLSGSGALSTNDLSLRNIKFMEQVADIVKKPSLKEARVKDLNIEFTIEEGRVHTKPFEIKTGDYRMELTGSTGLDQTIDYRGEITLPTSVGKISELGTVDMTIGGTFTSPKVGIDMAALAKKVARKAAESTLDKWLGVDSSKTAVSDSTATEKKQEEKEEKKDVKTEVTKKLINKAFDLFK